MEEWNSINWKPAICDQPPPLDKVGGSRLSWRFTLQFATQLRANFAWLSCAWGTEKSARSDAFQGYWFQLSASLDMEACTPVWIG